jgi:uncharacterized protein (DUF983 family)
VYLGFGPCPRCGKGFYTASPAILPQCATCGLPFGAPKSDAPAELP